MKKIASFLALILFSAMSFAASITAPTVDFGTISIKGQSLPVTDTKTVQVSFSGLATDGYYMYAEVDQGLLDDETNPNGFWVSPGYKGIGYGVGSGTIEFTVGYSVKAAGTFTGRLHFSCYDTNYDEVDGYANITITVTNEAIVAKTIPFERVNSLSELKNNDTIVFVSESAKAINGTYDGSTAHMDTLKTNVTIDAANGKAEIPETALMFKATQYSGNWQFWTVAATSKRLNLDIVSNNAKGAFTFSDPVASQIFASWGVTISSGVAVVSRADDDQTYPIRFNGDRFKPYKSASTGTDIAIYKKVGKAAEITSKLEIGAIDFGTVELDEVKEVVVNYTGENLTADIMWDITGTDKALFSVSPDESTNRTSGSVTVKYLGTASAVKTVDAKLYAYTQDAKLDDLEKEIPISITLAASTIKLTKIEFDNAPDSLVKGKSIDLKPYLVFTPNNAADKSLTWTVDPSYQGTVENGVYTAKNVTGSVTITATSVKVPSVSASITLMQYEPKPASINLDKHEITTYVGETVTLQGIVGPDGASQECYFTVRNKDILTYSKGDVTGSAKLTAKALCQEGTWVVVNPKNYQTILDSCLVKVIPVAVESVAFDPDTKEMTVGAIYQLVPVVTPAAAATQYTATYESNNTAVATVSETGLVTAKAEGTAKITCTLGGKSGQITINVIGAKYFTKVTDASKMQAGDTIILMANVGENPLVAGQVNSAKNCLDTILGGIITADNSVACDRALTLVVGGTTDNFTLTKLGTTSTLATSDNTKLGYSTSKNKWKFVAGAAGVMLTNASYNEKNICYNSQSKYIRMYAVGTTSTPLYVYVRPYAEPVKPAATGVSLDRTALDFYVGDADVTLKATVTPNDADQTVIWESSNTDVATVSANGKVHAVAKGTATITAKVKSNESLKAECAVTVSEWEVTEVKFDEGLENSVEVGKTITVSATAYPTGHGFKVTYSSSNTEIATVSMDGGVVKGIAAGDVIITAKSGDKEATLNVHVTAAAVPEDKGAISVADFLAAKDDFNIYTLTGVVANITNTKYGNFDLIDETGKIYIYGLLNAAGEAQKFAELNVAEKDTVTLKGSYSEHNNKAQIKDALFVSVKKYVEPVDPTAIEAVSIKGRATKVLREGQIIIIREEKEFDVVGRQLK